MKGLFRNAVYLFLCFAVFALPLLGQPDVINNEEVSPLLRIETSDHRNALLILEWEEQHAPDFSAQFENRKDYLTHILERFLRSSVDLKNADVRAASALIEKLIDGGADIAAIRPAYISYLAETAQFVIPSLIERGVPISAFNRNGRTLLYNAADKKNERLVTYLLGKGADPNEQGKSGETALMADSNAGIISLLMKAGADINLADNDGMTALMWAQKKETALLLMFSGADPTVKNRRGGTVLHSWISRLDEMPLGEVLSRGCYIDEPDNEGITPLMSAVRSAVNYAHSRVSVAILLKMGADPNLSDPQGRNALHRYLAEMEERCRETLGYKIYDFESITAILLEAGARPNVTDDEGNTALLIALRLSKRYESMAPLRDIISQYASVDEIKIAQSAASKTVAQEKRSRFNSDVAYSLPRIMGALSFPLAIGGLSIGMREGMYRDNPSENFMGPVNSVLNFTLGGMTLGILLFLPLASGGGWDNLFPFFGGIFGGIVGLLGGVILTAVIPSIVETVNNNPLLYYLPTAMSAIIVTLMIVKLRY